MPAKKNETTNSTDFIQDLYMNGLRGRMMIVPPANKKKSQEILMVYGQNSNLEYWFDIAHELSRYGRVTMPDLPGMGGMEGFCKINEKPSIENLADYLNSFIKLRYKRKRIVLVGCSFGFVIITRMLQKYPELVRRVDLLFAVSSFAHHDDLKLKRRQVIKLKLTTRLFSTRLPAQLYRWIYLDSFLSTRKLKQQYQEAIGTGNAKAGQVESLVDFEIERRKQTDTKAYMALFNQILSLDNCQQRINLGVWHISGAYDEYLDNKHVEQHLRIIFQSYNNIRLNLKSNKHKPANLSKLSATSLIPLKVRSLLKANMYK